MNFWLSEFLIIFSLLPKFVERKILILDYFAEKMQIDFYLQAVGLDKGVPLSCNNFKMSSRSTRGLNLKFSIFRLIINMGLF